MSDRAVETDTPVEVDRLTAIALMADVLADRVLNAQITGRLVPEADIHALLEASILLSEHGKDRPTLLSEIVRNISGGDVPENAEARDVAELEDVRRVAQSLQPLQTLKD